MNNTKEELSDLFEKNFNPNEEYLGFDKPVNKTVPLVSVSVITYQHADFIEECLDGILTQQTDFPFEIIIGEDHSTDGTREICKKYAEKHPDKIRLFLRDRSTSGIYDEEGNRVGGFNGKWNRKSARGKYIAICDGDDYWTDPLKLQKQVNFLENNSEYSGICSAYSIIDSSGTIIKKRKSLRKGKQISTNIYATSGFPKTSTVLYRNIKKLTNKQLSNLPTANGDVMLYYYMQQFGKLAYLDDVCCNYRLHGGGVHSSRDLFSKYHQTFRSLSMIKEFQLQNNVNDLLKRKHNKFANRLMILSLLKMDFQNVKYFNNYVNKLLIYENLKTTVKFVFRF